ncbi:MAG TPA: LuxR C-terminal-related transcriptional regulator [Trebonia sp.]|jgi:non-specific serine/threonine protein kinase|nr:LuxR C-terminal-related transcriptional regulator [Trebonia sp.]
MQRRPGAPPAEVTGFVGRQRELATVAGLLRSARLVTVTGPAGVGKTRLALRAAAAQAGRFPQGACFVDLAGLADPDLVPHTVAASLGLAQHDDRPGAQAVAGYLGGRRLLLVLDTCEHVLGGCGTLVGAVLREAPGVTVLATSRQPLDVPGEHCFALPPLPVPGPSATGTPSAGGDAVELFEQRAAALVPGFTVTPARRDDVIALCRRLDGIPLAIELAVTQLRGTSLRALADRLEHRFLELGREPGDGRGHARPHQQTLRATTQWSHDLCTPAEQALWARLAAFAGSFSLEAAEEVCAGGPLDPGGILPALVGLVDKSVVLRAGADASRYRLLDTIREFGAERLAGSGEEAAVRARHVAWLARQAADFARHDKDGDQLERFAALRREHANIRAALGYALDGAAGAGGAATLAAELRPYWEVSGFLREGRHWAGKILGRLPAGSPARARLLLTRGVLGAFAGDAREAAGDLSAATALAAEQGDALGCALGHAYLCLAYVFGGQPDAARAAAAEAEARLAALGHDSGLVSLDIHLGYLHLLSGEADQAIGRCEQGLGRLPAGERWGRSYLTLIKAQALLMRGEAAPSATAATEALALKHELGDIVGLAYCLESLAMLALTERQYERIAWLHGAADALWERTSKRFGGAQAFEDYHNLVVGAARDQLGPDRYAELFRAGGALDLDAAVRLASGQAAPPEPSAEAGTAGTAGNPGVPGDPGTAGESGQAAPAPVRPPRASRLGRPLTRREREVAELAGSGLTSNEIARRLVITDRTVDTHIAGAYAKLGISSRAQLAAWLATQGEWEEPGGQPGRWRAP